MPNWVTNDITITGDVTIIDAIRVQLAAPHETRSHVLNHDTRAMEWETSTSESVFSFWNITAPTNLDEYYTNRSQLHTSDNWYNWNCGHWGTKWNARRPRRGETTINPTTGLAEITYTFDTAWSPPDAALHTLSTQHPSVVITNRWVEEQGFGALEEYHGGEVNLIDEWDIPASHVEETYAHNGYCWRCEIADPDMLHPDCPRPTTDTTTDGATEGVRS